MKVNASIKAAPVDGVSAGTRLLRYALLTRPCASVIRPHYFV
jgi:hypothetical protein